MKKFLIAAIIVAAFVKPTQATQLPDPTVCNGTLVRNHQGVLHLELTNARCNGIIPNRLTKKVVKVCKVGGACRITGHPGGDYSDDHKDDDRWFKIDKVEEPVHCPGITFPACDDDGSKCQCRDAI